ncbi:serine/threonine-protein phosphatase 6 regulatory ankyrin repeat subunit B-like [Saccostrea echinata]|uniref:serine/threonine-protein phosphatase 6 regulatory ankyrin repeat subunit B-like n=1 Tax=Saccostrea echinata TaxID=191078 RepID=UPI002A7F9E19|nr:serine/threonine-protein phosphatase 6 regulatory ankyrin repeat subunit B-like [Saccostrea echinata]
MMNPNDVSEQNLTELISMEDFEWMINEIKDPIGMNLDMYQYIPEPITKEDISSETLPELMSKEDMEWIVNDVKDSIALDLAVYLIHEPKEEMRKKDENLPELISKEDMEWIVNDLKEDPIGMDLDIHHITESMTKTDMRILRSQMNDIANLLEDFKKTSKDTGMGLIQERLSKLEGQVNMMEKNMKKSSYQTRKDSPPLRNECIEDQHLVKTHEKKTQKQKSTPCVMLYDVQNTLNTVSSDGRNMELLVTLVDCGSNINAVNKNGYSPLNSYVKDAEKLKSKDVIDLISKGADPNCCPEGCESPLTNALKRKQYEIAKVLLESGALVNHVSKSGITALSMAVSQERTAYKTMREEIVDYLLEAGADANIQTEQMTSPLCNLLSCPFRSDTLAILSNLLQHNADPNIGTENPLCLASKVNSDAVELLLKAGTNVNRKGSDGNTPLVKCLDSKNADDMVETLKALIEAGADTNIASNTGKYPLEIVLENSVVRGNIHIVKESPRPRLWASMYSEEQTELHLEKLVSLLLDAGAKSDQCKPGVDSTLHIAVTIGETNVLKLLISNGADVNHIGENQETPLHRYLKKDTQNRNQEILKTTTKWFVRTVPILDSNLDTVLDILLSCKANPNTKDGDGNIPLRLALETNAEDFRKLLAAGADPFYEGENMFKHCVILDDFTFLNVLLQEKGTACICDSLFSSFWEKQNDATLYKNRLQIANVTLQMLSTPQELDVDRKNRSGKTPLLYFCEQNEDMVVERLLERGADVNMVDNEGRTALHTIFDSKGLGEDVKYHILTLLMKKKPDVKIKDATGKTVFQKAEKVYKENQEHYFFRYKDTDYRWLSFLMKETLLTGEICEKHHLTSLLLLAAQRKHFGFMTSLVEKDRQSVSHEECLNFLRIYKKHGGRLNEVDGDGNTPLMLFLKQGIYDFDDTQDKLLGLRDEIVSVLACDRLTVTKRDNTGLSAIHIVSSKGWLSTMKILVSKGANLCEKDDLQNTCLHHCLKEAPGEVVYDMVVYLVEKGILVNQLNTTEKSPLFILVERRETSEIDFVTTVEYLLKSGALPNLHLNRNNPLVAAIRSANVKVIALLLDYHAHVNKIDDGPTALHVFFRCFRNYIRTRKDDIEKVVHRILEKGAKVNDKDNDGSTVLHLAIKAFRMVKQQCNTESIIQQLLDFGADINCVDNSGQTPLSVVCETGSRGSVDQASLGCYLLSKGADPNIDFVLNQCMRNIDYYGLSAEWKVFIQSLIQNGADPNLYRDGNPPILLAIRSGLQDLVKLFLEKGASIYSSDKDENTCLHLACDLKAESSRNEIASLVLEHGCSINKQNKCGIAPLSNLIKRITEDADSMKIGQTETAIVAKVDLSLFNRLICGGAKMDPAIQSTSYHYRKSILATLLKNGFFGAAATLLKCGYNFKLDKDFKNVELSHLENSTISVKGKSYKRINYDQEKTEFFNVLKKYEVEEESSLSSLCRNTIRTHLIDVRQGAEIESKIMSLPIPGRIKTYLALREYTQDFEQIQIEEKKSSPIGFNIRTLLDDYYDMYHYGAAYYGMDDSDVDEYLHYYRDTSDSDDYYY